MVRGEDGRWRGVSDLIDREQLRRALYEEAMVKDSEDQRWDGGCWIRYRMAERLIEEAPTVQPEITEEQVKEYCQKRCLVVLDSSLFHQLKQGQPELIRCKECKYADEYYRCPYTTWWGRFDDFCSRAERRE